jgi:hypothetical protein
MNTNQVAKYLHRSVRTIRLYRLGRKTIKGKRIWLLPDHSTIPRKWIRDKTVGRGRWEYDKDEVKVWIKKLKKK